MNWTGHWQTTEEFSRTMNRPLRTVREWAINGTLIEFGIPVYCINRGKKNTRFFIYTSAELIEK